MSAQTHERFKPMKRLTVLVLAFCVAPACTLRAAADSAPSTQPAQQAGQTEPGDDAAPQTTAADASTPRASGQDIAADTVPIPPRFSHRQGRMDRPLDWEAIERFATLHSPRRWRAFDATASGTSAAARAKQFVAESFQKLMDLKDREPDVYDCRVVQIEQEDAIYGICTDVRNGKLTREQAAPKLRETVNHLVDARLKERDVRVKKAMADLSKAAQKLERDQQQRDKLVDRQVNAIIDNGYVPNPPRRSRGHDQ